jgi:2-polyprenyl-3-methyl-5-hydroxy-6-metoxy-1,4-benzoquinol methylase
LGVDFNPHAIERARAVATELDLKSEFFCQDLFEFAEKGRPEEERFDLIVSLGVLHHTKNCIEGLRRIIENLLMEKGYFFVSLYHKYGREPFLEYFEELKKQI